jgi:hypothetical protein
LEVNHLSKLVVKIELADNMPVASFIRGKSPVIFKKLHWRSLTKKIFVHSVPTTFSENKARSCLKKHAGDHRQKTGTQHTANFQSMQ